MKAFDLDDVTPGRPLNAVALRNAVLCADCDVVSDSPHDRCLVCGSPSLFNISRVLGGLPKIRATLIETETLKNKQRTEVVVIGRVHKMRRRLLA